MGVLVKGVEDTLGVRPQPLGSRAPSQNYLSFAFKIENSDKTPHFSFTVQNVPYSPEIEPSHMLTPKTEQ